VILIKGKCYFKSPPGKCRVIRDYSPIKQLSEMIEKKENIVIYYAILNSIPFKNQRA